MRVIYAPQPDVLAHILRQVAPQAAQPEAPTLLTRIGRCLSAANSLECSLFMLINSLRFTQYE